MSKRLMGGKHVELKTSLSRKESKKSNLAKENKSKLTVAIKIEQMIFDMDMSRCKHVYARRRIRITT